MKVFFSRTRICFIVVMSRDYSFIFFILAYVVGWTSSLHHFSGTASKCSVILQNLVGTF